MRVALVLALATRALGQTCFDASSTTLLNFDGVDCSPQGNLDAQYPNCQQATTFYSNLGGQGSGNRVPTDPNNGNGAEGILITNVARARMKDPSNPANGHLLDLRINLASQEYIPNNVQLNGIQQMDQNGFGVINMQSPVLNPPAWHEGITWAEFTFTLIDQTTGNPLDVTGGFETWVTFYDFDHLLPSAGQTSDRAVECGSAIPLNGGTVTAYLEDDPNVGSSIDITTMTDMRTKADADISYPSDATRPSVTGDWANARVFCSGTHGVSSDNPTDPISLAVIHRQRSVYTQVLDTNSVSVRLFVHSCCNPGGRNFLFAGRPNLEPCQSPPPSPPPPSPSPPPVVAVEHDPHLTFAHGGKADFRGKDRTWYNLLSAKNVSLNALFTEADFHILKPRKQLVHGSRMEQMAMTVRTDAGRILSIEYNATDKQPFVALVHQRSEPAHHVAYLTTDKKFARYLEVDNLKISLRVKKIGGILSTAGHGTALIVNTGKWEVSAMSKPFANSRAHPGKALLNINLHALYDADHDVVAPHGLIGQSYDGDSLQVDGRVDDYKPDEVTTAAMAEGAIEGVGADYEMASRFATDFKYSRFDAVAAAARDVSKLSGDKRSATSKSGAVGANADLEDDESKIETDVA